jgi:hypothetical protein
VQLLNSAPPRGFETAVRIRGRQPFVEVQALDAHGAVLGSSLATATH